MGVTGTAVALWAPAFASVVHAPAITSTDATFVIPTAGTSTWTLRLWSHGTLEGSDQATSGTLSVAVPVTSDCFFQADVSVTPVGGQSYFYSGSRATVPGCGPPATIAGDIDLCSSAGTPTTSEVGGGTLAASGPQNLATKANPVAPTTVPSGSYVMSAGAPSGYVFVVCGGTSTVGSSGVTATESVVVPAGGAGNGIFYVVAAAPTGSLTGGGPPASVTAGGVPAGGGAPSSSPGKSSPTLAAQPRPTPVGSSRLALTGLDVGPLLVTGLLALAGGILATAVSRVRRRTRRLPAHARR